METPSGAPDPLSSTFCLYELLQAPRVRGITRDLSFSICLILLSTFVRCACGGAANLKISFKRKAFHPSLLVREPGFQVGCITMQGTEETWTRVPTWEPGGMTPFPTKQASWLRSPWPPPRSFLTPTLAAEMRWECSLRSESSVCVPGN